jgi:DNA-binding MarR family transcriptional regulator
MTGRSMKRAELERAVDREVGRLSTWMVTLHNAAAERLGLNPTDLVCLYILNETGAITAGQLAQLSSLTSGAITGVIDRLEKAGYVQRESDANDRRRVIIQPIAGRAREVNQMFESTSHSITAEVITRYDEPERALILDFLTRVTSSLLQEYAALRAEKSADKNKR